MTPLKKLIEELNDISSTLVNELRKDKPSIDFIKSEMQTRGSLIGTINNECKKYPATSLSGDERGTVQSLFNHFLQLNSVINEHLTELKAKQSEHLSTAIRQIKASKGYKIKKNPDLSYF